MPKSIRVRDYMSGNVITFTPDMEILEAVHILVTNRISGAPVLDLRGNLIGMLSERDCIKVALNAAYHNEWGGRVEEFMSREVKTVLSRPDQPPRHSQSDGAPSLRLANSSATSSGVLWAIPLWQSMQVLPSAIPC